MPAVLYERKQDGSLTFPKIDQMHLRGVRNVTEGIVLQVQNALLQTVLIRFEDLTARRLGHARIPREIVTSRQFQEELERYVPSLVLF